MSIFIRLDTQVTKLCTTKPLQRALVTQYIRTKLEFFENLSVASTGFTMSIKYSDTFNKLKGVLQK